MSRSHAVAFLLALAACSHDDYPDCGTPAAISVANTDIADGDALALPKGVETDMALQVTDAEGDLCDPSGVALAFDDPGQIEVVSTGEATVLKPRFDAIDLGAEPTTVLRATLGDLQASWPVVSVVSLGGAWTVTITEVTRFPNGYTFAGVSLVQHGRRLAWEDCSVPVVCARDAVVRDAAFTAEAPDIGLSVTAPVDPDRARFAGPWSAKGYMGEFIATRAE
ncbi:MAG TPA: hypothetical protein VJ694_00800 [Patescibacteria group bacterium]|nr:hypothetical protein [Patescibacteria group bacterium]